MKKVLSVSFLTFMIFLLIINFLMLFDMPFFGYKIYKVSSKSMEPNLKYNDFILIKEKTDFKENDIITFKVENKYITHRVVEIKDERIITKGDAVDFDNDPISKDMVVGKMIYKFKVLTYINYFLFKPIFWIIFISLYGIIFFIKTRRKNK